LSKADERHAMQKQMSAKGQLSAYQHFEAPIVIDNAAKGVVDNAAQKSSIAVPLAMGG
jgi:hypothetical protein